MEIKSIHKSTATVTLDLDKWQQLLGMIENGTQSVLSQLAMQSGSLRKVSDLSTIAVDIVDEIRKQLGSQDG